jgi:hypothetical protein
LGADFHVALTAASRRLLEGISVGPNLALSLYPHDPSGRRVVILNAYYDESGTHAGSTVTVMAGLVGDVNDWIEFDREWDKILRKYEITHVHAKHLFHRQGMYKGWGEQKSWRLLVDLMYVIQERKQLFISRSFLLEDHYLRVYLAKKPERRERLDSRYALCFRAFLHFLPSHHRDHFTRGTVNFILESGHRNAGDALRVFNEFKADKNFEWRDSMGTLSFGGKEGFPALQAADLMAYSHYKVVSDYLEDRDNDWDTIGGIESELLESGVPIVSHPITLEDLRALRNNYQTKRPRKVFERAILFDRDEAMLINPSSPHLVAPEFVRRSH